MKYQHAFELSSDTRLLWNMAACEKGLRHYVKARALVQRFLDTGGDTLAESDRRGGTEFLEATASFVSALRIEVNEPGAEISVDDEPVGSSPLATPILVDLGAHRIKAKKPGFREVVEARTVSGSDEVRVAFALVRDVRTGRIVVSAGSSDAIAIDGKPVATGRWEGPLAEGQHQVEVTAAGMHPYRNDVLVRDAETRSLLVSLESEKHGVSPWVWLAGGVAVAAGIGVGGYFLFKPRDGGSNAPTSGSLPPGTIQIP